MGTKIKQNAASVFHFFSFEKTIALPCEIVLSDKSLNIIKWALVEKKHDSNVQIQKKEILAALEYLKKEGKIIEVGTSWKIAANDNWVMDDRKSMFLGRFLESVLPINPENNISWYHYKKLTRLTRSYIKNYIYTDSTKTSFTTVCERVITYLIYSGNLSKGMELVRQAEKMAKAIPDNLLFTANLTARKAEILRKKGENQAAIRLLNPIIREMEKNATQFQLELAQLYTELGLTLLYNDNNEFSRAENYLQRALYIRQILLGEEHILTIAAHLNIANYHVQMGMGAKAIECTKATLPYLEPYNNQYYVANTYDILGLATFYTKDIPKAIEYCEKGLLIRKQILKENHTLMLESLHNMGQLLYYANKPGEAIHYFNKTYAGFKKVYSPEHQNYVITVGANAICNLSLNNIDQAEYIVLKELDKVSAYPRNSFNMYESAIEKLILYYHTSRNRMKEMKFIKVYIKLLQNRKTKYDYKYRIMLLSYVFLLKSQQKCDGYLWANKELSNYFNHEIQESVKSKNIKAGKYNDYAMLFKNKLNDFRRSEDCYKKVMELYPTCSTYLSNYALLLTSIKKQDDLAEELYLKALKLDQTNSVLYGNYAFFLQNVRKKFQIAEEYYQIAQSMAPWDAANLANYASLKLIQGHFSQAKTLISKSLMIGIPSPNRHTARPLFLSILISMFNHENYDDFLGNMKYLFIYNIDHVCWDNRELMSFAGKILNGSEYLFLEAIFNTINDYVCLEKLQSFTHWNKVKPKPFVSNYRSFEE
ncbi:tetratricopeptide repeat protein [Saccharicrinis sp. 156]|uniref:tetratricopeptide repeat protein n=1 Tax=Saccharicrinis sp. 156 TaxID=3417574 RepID=UPI003D33297F